VILQRYLAAMFWQLVAPSSGHFLDQIQRHLAVFLIKTIGLF
jgi:hypothetical protein